MKKERMASCSWVEKVCPICGKTFIPHTEEWAYKRKITHENTKYFCSWGCLQNFENHREKPLAIQQREEIIKLIKKGMSTSDIVRTLGVDRTKVRYWKERVAKEGNGE